MHDMHHARARARARAHPSSSRSASNTHAQAKSAPVFHYDAPNESFYTLIAVDLGTVRVYGRARAVTSLLACVTDRFSRSWLADALVVDHEPTPKDYSRFSVADFKAHRLHWLVYVLMTAPLRIPAVGPIR